MNRDMMRQLQQMQDRLAKAQAKLSETVVEGTAGGGAVTVKMNGDMKVEGIKISPDVVDPEDVEMLEDLVLAALNEAVQKVQQAQASQLGGITGGLNIPGLG
jgi:DNA-binding YbaB/EbfC family protein